MTVTKEGGRASEAAEMVLEAAGAASKAYDKALQAGEGLRGS